MDFDEIDILNTREILETYENILTTQSDELISNYCFCSSGQGTTYSLFGGYMCASYLSGQRGPGTDCSGTYYGCAGMLCGDPLGGSRRSNCRFYYYCS